MFCTAVFCKDKYIGFSKSLVERYRLQHPLYYHGNCDVKNGQPTDDKLKLRNPLKIISSPFNDLIIPNYNLVEFLNERMNKWSDHIAIECGITGRKYTYNEIILLSARFATSLDKHEYKSKKILSIMLPNLPEYPIILLGALQAGFIVSTINPAYTQNEISYQLADTHTNVVVLLPESCTTIENSIDVIRKSNKNWHNIHRISMNVNGEPSISGYEKFTDMIDESVPIYNKEMQCEPDDTAAILYSSGTTGLPKGVELTHRNIIANILQRNKNEIAVIQSPSKSFQEILPGVLPMFHCFGLNVELVDSIYGGGKIVTLPKFRTKDFLKVLKDHKATWLYAVPPMYLMLANHPAVSTHHLKSLRMAFTGAAPLGASDQEKICNKVTNKDFKFLQVYGMTEMCSVAAVSINHQETSVYPLANTKCKIVKSDGTLAGPNELGEMCMKGPQLMKSYLNNPEATDQSIDDCGFIKSGDLAYYDENFAFHIVDRLKEIIKVNGFQVAPAEIEGLLRTHEVVNEAAVIGFPDVRTGEKPVAFVSLKDMNRGDKMLEENLIKFISQRVAPYKHLSQIIFIDKIPTNPSGKILRRVLKKEYTNHI